MRWKCWLTIAVFLLLTNSVETFAQASKPQPHSIHVLRNRDILLMVQNGVKSHVIIANIMTSHCAFDIFPPVLEDLKRRGVPENVLHFMSVVPNGPPNLPETDKPSPESLLKSVQIPQGTVVTVETLYPISSADFKINNTIAFSVVRPVYADGVLLIPRGTIARAKIIRVKKAGSFGRGGALSIEMDSIVAVDGTRIPVQLTANAEGGNRSGVLAVGAAATSALIFPYTAPAAIVWGFKKGDDAVIRGSKQFAAVVKTDTQIVGLIPDKDKIIYHYAEALKAKQNSAATPAVFPRLTIRN
ncbi:MAG TPA: hypothetical protein VHS05_05155 [Pyrinomonadaceae bacterium]|jgi:hypothetical protein|nr:hypothetical protein [Pyrinomonadaceae bacterium]